MHDKLFSVLLSILTLSIFIIVIDITKSIFKKYYHKDNKKNEIIMLAYLKGEFKFIFIITLIFIISLIFIFYQMRNLIKFDVVFHLFRDKDLTQLITGSVFILILNGCLYLGYLIQIIKRYEYLNSETKDWILIVKENLYGPILEEILYRGIIFNILFSNGFSNLESALISSIMFGLCINKIFIILAHLRHVFDHDFQNLGAIIFQASFTSVFGLYACYSYVKGGTLLSPIILHCCCNTLQFPRFSYLDSDEILEKEKKIISFSYITGISVFILILFVY